MSARTLALAATLVSLVLPAQARTPEALSPQSLRAAYLACERAATAERMDTGGVMECSAIYEELKRRVFGGDFGRLRAWSDPLLGRAPGGDAAAEALLF
ncbi:MAG TPA: hypothetical protein VLE27_13055 [Thermoanaerobaculia bacterium]|jgi:hypothetical protein|nr:hypothetical protein [Thermoanaerobaculia bacterium]